MHRRTGAVVGLAVTLLAAPRADGAETVAVTGVSAAEFPVIRVYYSRRGADGRTLPRFEEARHQVAEDGRSLVAWPLPEEGGYLPFDVVLVVDSSGSMQGVMDKARSAAKVFIGRMARGDRLALIDFDSSVRPVADSSGDKAALTAAADRIEAGGGTALYDAVAQAVRSVKPADRLTAVVALTDGKDESASGREPGSKLGRAEMLALLGQRGVPVFAVGLGDAVDRETLEAIAAASGGKAYAATDADALQKLYEDIFDYLRGLHGFTYAAHRCAADGSDRSARINLGGNEVEVAYRAPRDADGTLWRCAYATRPGSQCQAGALSPSGNYAYMPEFKTLIGEDGTRVNFARSSNDSHARSVVTDAGVVYILDWKGGERRARGEAELGASPRDPTSLPKATGDGERGAWTLVGASRSGGFELLRAGGKQTMTLALLDTGKQALLWQVTPCKGDDACAEVSGAALDERGDAAVVVARKLFRVDRSGKLTQVRGKGFFTSVSISDDGRFLAAVEIGKAGKATLFDGKLDALVSRPYVSKSFDAPAAVAVSAQGTFFAVLDDEAVHLTTVAAKPAWTKLAFPAPLKLASCGFTLALANDGRVLYSDGRQLVLHRGLSQASR